MAQILQADSEQLIKDLTRSFQSGHINFLLGAGASFPAIPLAGDVEAEIDALLTAGNQAAATQRMFELLHAIQEPVNAVIDDAPTAECTATLNCYQQFLQTIERILAQRRTTVLPKQATVF